MNSAAKILIVDDNPNIHEILEQLLLSHVNGTTAVILHADNGRNALDILGTNPDTDVIILDLNMPVMDGFEFLAIIKADARIDSIPVCVFSGNEGDATKALELGALDFIPKPGNYQEIKLRILNLIARKRQIEAGRRARIDFLHTVSHELRTPMNGVYGAMQLLQMTELTDEQSEYVEMLEQSTQTIMTMINSVLNLLQSENPLHNLPVIPFSLRATLQETVDDLASRAGNGGVTLTRDLHPALPDNLIGLPDKIQLIFHHLLCNAIKFSPSGSVTVRIEPGERNETSVQLLCSVTDTGIGITPETHSAIFEPFTRAEASLTRTFGGLGIGLSIAGRIVQLMGGVMRVESIPGVGSTFSFAVTCGIDQTRT
ncbi:MAG: ATP-binding protein [Desulfuromonadaceae bacterium]